MVPGPNDPNTPFAQKVADAAAARAAKEAASTKNVHKPAGKVNHTYAATEKVLGSPMPTEAEVFSGQKHGLIIRKSYEEEDIPRDFFRRVDNLGPSWPTPPPPPPKPKPKPGPKPEQRVGSTEISIPMITDLITRFESEADAKRAYAANIRSSAKMVPRVVLSNPLLQRE